MYSFQNYHIKIVSWTLFHYTIALDRLCVLSDTLSASKWAVIALHWKQKLIAADE
jgi:hypothetical protein